MPRLLLALFAFIALVSTASPHQQSGSQTAQSVLPPGPAAAASDAPAQTTTALSLLQQSHQVEEQLPMSARVNLLPRLAQSVSTLSPDLAREWAAELLALSSQVKGKQQLSLQRTATTMLIRLDPDHALEHLHAMKIEGTNLECVVSPKTLLARKVFGDMIERGGIDAFPSLEQEAERMESEGQYPYAALAYAAMQAVSKYWGGDNQHAIQVLQSAFEPAFAKYTQSAHRCSNDLEFGEMLRVLAGGLPFNSVQPALRMLVKNLLAIDAGKYELYAQVYTEDGQTAKAENVIDGSVMILGSLINRDPELVQQLVSARPELKTILEYTKDGRQRSMEFGQVRPRSGHPLPLDPNEEIRMDALRLSDINADAAIAKAKQLPDEERSSTILSVARDIALKDPGRAATLIKEAQHSDQAAETRTRLNLLSARASVAAAQNRGEEFRALLERAFEVANQLALEEQGNTALQFAPGLAPLIQVGVQYEPSLTIAFLRSLSPSYEKAELLLAAAQSLNMPPHHWQPLKPQQPQHAKN